MVGDATPVSSVVQYLHTARLFYETVALCLKGDPEVHQYEDDLAELVSSVANVQPLTRLNYFPFIHCET